MLPLPVFDPPVPDPPLDCVQLERTLANSAAKAISVRALRRRRRAAGRSASPQTSGRAGHGEGGAEPVLASVTPVAISATTFPMTFGGRPSLAGLKVQELLEGSVPHWKVKMPSEPFSGVTSRLYSATWPLATACLDDPLEVKVKSKPRPESARKEPVGRALLVTVRLPFWAPELTGTNAIDALQLAPGASVVPQVVLVN